MFEEGNGYERHRLPKYHGSNARTHHNEERKKLEREQFPSMVARPRQSHQQSRSHAKLTVNEIRKKGLVLVLRERTRSRRGKHGSHSVIARSPISSNKLIGKKVNQIQARNEMGEGCNFLATSHWVESPFGS